MGVDRAMATARRRWAYNDGTAYAGGCRPKTVRAGLGLWNSAVKELRCHANAHAHRISAARKFASSHALGWSMVMTLVANVLLGAAEQHTVSPGFCGKTTAAHSSDCARDERGTFPVRPADTVTWPTMARACMRQ